VLHVKVVDGDRSIVHENIGNTILQSVSGAMVSVARMRIEVMGLIGHLLMDGCGWALGRVPGL
jgi:hypothetical protein